MAQDDAYEDFHWFVHADMDGSGRYWQQVERAPAGRVRGDVPVGDLRAVLEEGLPRLLADPDAELDLEELRRFGARLLRCLTGADGGDAVAHLYHDAVATLGSERLRVTLEVEAPELMHVPWEYIFDPGLNSYLVINPRISLVRGMAGAFRRRPSPLNPAAEPLRLWIVIASPVGPPPLDIPEEQAALHAALMPLLDEGLIEVRWLPEPGAAPHTQGGATREELFECVEAVLGGQPGPHIIHFVCHGMPGYGGREGRILLEGPRRTSAEITASELAESVAQLRALRLVVLSSCLTARTNDISEFGGVAQALVGAGVPAVIGMQHQIPITVARTFAKAFYGTLFEGLVRGGDVNAFEIALAAARRRVWQAHRLNRSHWGTPVLYARAGAGNPLPLISRPALVTSAAQARIDDLASRRSYELRKLDYFSSMHGNPLPDTLPIWVTREVEEARLRLAQVTAELRGLGAEVG
jgi:hypothetical protein